jgi:hypothetical protein
MIEEQAVAGPTDEKPASRWEDYIDVFIAPVELFRRRAHDKVSTPLLTLMGLGIVLYFILLPANQMIMRAGIPDDPNAAQFMERFGGIFSIVGAVMVPIMYGIMIAVAAALLWLVGRFASIRIDYNRAALIATYAGFIFLLASTVGLVAVVIHGEAGLDIVRDLSFGPLRFIGSEEMNASLTALLRRFELFTLWQAALWAIGIREIYKVSTMHAAVVAGFAWLLGAIPGVIMGALGIGQAAAGG